MLRTEMPEPESMPEQVLRSAVPEARLREPDLKPISKLSEPVKEFVPEPLLREPSIRVPFGEYLRDDDEEFSERRWGRWVLAALLLIGVAGGAMVYRSQGWQGFIDGWQHGKALAGAVVAKTRLAMDEAKGLSAKPAPSAAQTQSTEPAGSEAGTAPAAQSSAPAAQSSAPAAQSSAPAAQSSASPVPAQAAPVTAAAQPPASTTASTTQTAAAAAPEATRKAATPEKMRGRVVIEESGVSGGAASPGREAITAPVPSAARVFGGAVPPVFVEASRLTALSKTQPEYPNDAAAQKITGDVVVQAIISPTGAVESAQIVSGPPGLLKASLDAMKSWRYQPYLVNGVPVEVRTYVKFRFERDE
jgi:periplasmic protein TonB